MNRLSLNFGMCLLRRSLSAQLQRYLPESEPNTEPATDICRVRTKTIKAGDWQR